MTILKKIPVLGRIVEITYTMTIVVVLSAIVGGILAYPVMWLWNYVFTFYEINIFQAWALNVLTGILFNKGSSK
jgi:hypothetical protein